MSPVDRGAALLALALLAACGGPASQGPAGAAAPTATRAAAAPGATPSAPPTLRPSPLVSAKGTITVADPASGQALNGGVVVSGEASVFEATLEYRVITTAGKVLAQGHTTASAGAPQKGTYRVEVRFEVPYYGEPGFVEVFERSPKDGAIAEIVRVPVTITGSY